MGNQLAATSASSSADFHLHDLGGLTFVRSLGGGRLMKSIECIHDVEGRVSVKVYLKRDEQESLQLHEKKLAVLKDKFLPSLHGNVAPYRFFRETEKAGYLVRQYFKSNLVDRLSTRPFLSNIEKRWIAFQLLNAAQQIHDMGITHGDIKSENVMVTSWNWVLLTDFASFKPTLLPADNPADFSFFFDTGDRGRRCYLAPERFVDGKVGKQSDVTPAMDIFSIGCVLAELFTDGEVLFDLAKLLRFRNGDLDVRHVLERKIHDAPTRNMLLNMLSLKPERRHGATHYLQQYTGTVFPAYFGTYLYGFLFSLLGMTPDDKVTHCKLSKDKVLRSVAVVRRRRQKLKPDEIRNKRRSALYKMSPSGIAARRLSASSGGAPALSSISEAMGGSRADSAAEEGAGESGAAHAEAEAEAGGAAPAATATRKRTLSWRPQTSQWMTPVSSTRRGSGTSGTSTPVSTEESPAAAAPSDAAASSSSASTPATTPAAAPADDDNPLLVEEGFAEEVVGESVEESLLMLDEMRRFQQQLAEEHAEEAAAAVADLDAGVPWPKPTAIRFTVPCEHIPGVPSCHAPPASTGGGGGDGTDSAAPATVPTATPARKPVSDIAVAPPVEESVRMEVHSAALDEGDSGVLIVADLLCTTLRNVSGPHAKVDVLRLLASFAPHLSDTALLQRVVPFIVSQLKDRSPLVRASAVRSLTRVMAQVTSFPISDAHVFDDYLFPSLAFLPSDGEVSVRAAFAECVARLAETARKFVDMGAYMRQAQQTAAAAASSAAAVAGTSAGSMPGTPTGSDPGNGGGGNADESEMESYDAQLERLHTTVSTMVHKLLVDQSSAVRCTLLRDISRLCLFFGRTKTNDFVLPMLITFLNDRDWELRCAFFQHIVGVCAYVGSVTLQHFILPCIEQALYDVEPFVTERALSTLACLCDLGLFDKARLIDLCGKACPLLFHPSIWIRHGTILFLSAVGQQLNDVDVHCYVFPMLQPYLKRSVLHLNQRTLLTNVKPPLPRWLFERQIKRGPDEHRRRRTGAVSISADNTSASPAASAHSADGTKAHARRGKASMVASAAMAAANGAGSGAWAACVSSEDETKLQLMADYIRLASQERLNKKRGTEAAGPQLADDPTKRSSHQYRNLSQIAPMYTPSPKKMASLDMLPSIPQRDDKPRVDEWSEFFGGEDGEDSERPVAPPVPKHAVTSAVPGGAPYWRPQGMMVTHLHEHQRAVNELCVSDDSVFFASGSDDGRVLVWESARLETDVTNCARLAYASQGGKITALSTVENSHSVVSGSDLGSVHVVRVEYTQRASQITEPLKAMGVVHAINPDEGKVLAVTHFGREQPSLVVYTTQQGNVHGWDLRTKREAWVLENGGTMGLLNRFDVDRKGHNWLVAGTNRGYVCAWDLRFQLRFNEWRVPSHSPVHDVSIVAPAPPKTSGHVALACGENMVSVWDVAAAKCTTLLRVVATEGVPLPNLLAEPLPTHRTLGRSELKAPVTVEPSIRTLCNPLHHPLLFTAGSSRDIVAWNLKARGESFIMCGEGKGSYTHTPKFMSSNKNGISVLELQMPPHQPQSQQFKGPTSPPTYHTDAITDLVALRHPSRFLVSACRDGTIKVWQ